VTISPSTQLAVAQFEGDLKMKTLALVLALAFAAPLAAHADQATSHGYNGNAANVPAYQSQAGNGG
jgi:hypothetical protein